MKSALRALSLILLALLAGSAGAQQATGPYIQVSPTPSKLSVGGPGFVQVDANGIAKVVAQAPGSGTVTNTAGALAINSMVVGNSGADIKTIGGSIGGSFTTAGNVTFTGAPSGLTLAYPSGGPFTYTFPLATSTLASLAGSETFTNKIYSGGQLSGTFTGNPTLTGVPLFTNLLGGTQTVCLGLDSTFHLVTSAGACGAGGGSGITIGTTAITGGTTTRILFDNAGAVGEYSISGSGNVAMTTSPTFVTPILGTPTSVALPNAIGLPLTTGVTGVLPAANGGTGVNNASNTITLNSVVSLPAHPGSTQCIHMSAAGDLTTTGSDCGSSSASGTVTNSANLTNNAPVVGDGGTVGVKTTAAMTNGQVLVGATGAAPAPQSLSQDCTMTSGGVVTCTKTNNVAFGTAATVNTGTSGATLPLLNGMNTWSGTQTFGAIVGTVVARSGTTDTLAAGDCGTTIEYTSASAVTVTGPNSLVIGCHIAIVQGGAGQVTVAAGSGATLVSAHSYTKTFGQNAGIGLSVIENAGGTAAKYFLFGDGA